VVADKYDTVFYSTLLLRERKNLNFTTFCGRRCNVNVAALTGLPYGFTSVIEV